MKWQGKSALSDHKLAHMALTCLSLTKHSIKLKVWRRKSICWQRDVRSKRRSRPLKWETRVVPSPKKVKRRRKRSLGCSDLVSHEPFRRRADSSRASGIYLQRQNDWTQRHWHRSKVSANRWASLTARGSTKPTFTRVQLLARSSLKTRKENKINTSSTSTRMTFVWKSSKNHNRGYKLKVNKMPNSWTNTMNRTSRKPISLRILSNRLKARYKAILSSRKLWWELTLKALTTTARTKRYQMPKLQLLLSTQAHHNLNLNRPRVQAAATRRMFRVVTIVKPSSTSTSMSPTLELSES